MRLLNKASVVLILSFIIGLVCGVCSIGAWAQGNGQDPRTFGEIQKIAPAGIGQDAWNQQIERCKGVSAELVRRQSLPEDQQAHLPNIYYDIENCRDMISPVQGQTVTAPIDPIKPFPVSTPTPPASPAANPQR